mmetsp:Transcript_56731/g.175931  ORF Transcript_56731/g.175931 Transcript_56731/m.175931 type:complete len:222 (-) Transcript_56731:86-751(-)
MLYVAGVIPQRQACADAKWGGHSIPGIGSAVIAACVHDHRIGKGILSVRDIVPQINDLRLAAGCPGERGARICDRKCLKYGEDEPETVSCSFTSIIGNQRIDAETNKSTQGIDGLGLQGLPDIRNKAEPFGDDASSRTASAVEPIHRRKHLRSCQVHQQFQVLGIGVERFVKVCHHFLLLTCPGGLQRVRLQAFHLGCEQRHAIVDMHAALAACFSCSKSA